MAALKEYHFEIGPMDDSSQCVAIVGIEYSSVSEDEAFYAKEDVMSALAEKDEEIQVLKQKLMMYGDANARLSNENTNLKLITESKDTELAQLRSDIADLRDDKKTTDAILDERNAEIAELQDKLRASEQQNENLINSASQIMILQDKALANSTNARTVFKRCPRAQLAQLAENAIRALADPAAYSTFELTIDTGDAPMAMVSGASHG